MYWFLKLVDYVYIYIYIMVAPNFMRFFPLSDMVERTSEQVFVSCNMMYFWF